MSNLVQVQIHYSTYKNGHPLHLVLCTQNKKDEETTSDVILPEY